MRSIYERALGADFARLHPQIQRRFGFDSSTGLASVGTGVMEEIWHGPRITLPFLKLGATRNLLFPERGSGIPFRVENYAYRDPHGRESMTWIRTFETRPRRRFDAYMVYSERRGCLLDYLGTHQHLGVDLELSVDGRGGLRLRSGSQRFHELPFSFTFPAALSGHADVCEWFDDSTGRFRIEVDVRNPILGPIFGYRGWFSAEWTRTEPGFVPDRYLPRRVEVRE